MYKHVAFDCDGILYDFIDGFTRSVPRQYHDKPVNRYAFAEDWGMTPQEFGLFAIQGFRNRILYWTGIPLPGAVETVNKVKAAGHKVTIPTHRGTFGETADQALEATEYWLKTHGFNYDEIVICEDKTSVDADYMIEDKPSNFEQLLKHGTEAYLLDQPWNRDHKTDRRLYQLQEYADLILSI